MTDRIRAAASTAIIAIGSALGLVIGGYLGLITERGAPGLVTVVGAVVGTGVGIYLAQLIVGASDDDA